MNNVNQQEINAVAQPAIIEATPTEQPGDGLRLYQGVVLDQLPGAAFAAITLVWLFSSFGKLVF